MDRHLGQKKSWLQNPSYQTLRQSLQQGPNICLTRSRNHHNLRSTSGKERNKLWMWEKIKQHNSPDSSQSLGLCVELSSVYTLPSSLQRSSSLCIRSCLPYKCWASLTPSSAGSAFPCSPPWGYLLETPCKIFFFFFAVFYTSPRDGLMYTAKQRLRQLSLRWVSMDSVFPKGMCAWKIAVSHFPHHYMTCL